MTSIEPGWYKDPAAPETQRWWDGEQWVGKPEPADVDPPERPEPLPVVAPAEPPAAPPPPSRAATRRSGGSARPQPRLPAGTQPASPALRLGARVLDILALSGLNLVVNGWFAYQWLQSLAPMFAEALADPQNAGTLEPPPESARHFTTMMIIALLLWFLYEVPGTVSGGQTLGKRAMRIKVVSLHESKLRYSTVISRWSLLSVGLVCFPYAVPVTIVDGMWCLFDRPLRQCLHDKFPATAVVSVGKSESKVKGDADGPLDPR